VPIETFYDPLELQKDSSSIHPQGWVPIETFFEGRDHKYGFRPCSIHPQGWVPIETSRSLFACHPWLFSRSIHPQGWVPIETAVGFDGEQFADL